MKSLILTSSIFFILGLKMTHNIEPNQKMDADTVQITVPAEKDLPDKIEKQNDLIIAPKEEKDAIGSGQLTAPVPSLSVGKAR